MAAWSICSWRMRLKARARVLSVLSGEMTGGVCRCKAGGRGRGGATAVHAVAAGAVRVDRVDPARGAAALKGRRGGRRARRTEVVGCLGWWGAELRVAGAVGGGDEDRASRTVRAYRRRDFGRCGRGVAGVRAAIARSAV